MARPKLILISMLLLPLPCTANLILNGSFEQGPDVGSTFIDLPAGSTAILGWTVGGFHIDYSGPGTWNISDGIRNIDLDGSVQNANRNGAISQAFSTTIGQRYSVTFDLSGNPAGFPLLKQLEVSAGDAAAVFGYGIGAVVAPSLPLHISYSHQEFSFNALASLSTLTFRSLTQQSGLPGFGAIIDNVVVQSVPVPSPLALLFSSLAALLLTRRRSGKSITQ
jgi:choice-of-anchor C domain-containing protein